MSDSTTLRDGTTVDDPRLDLLVKLDPRSLAYPSTAVVPAAAPLRPKTWRSKLWLDQGREGACVSFSLHHEAGASPVAVGSLNNDTARQRYHEIQRRDEWEGGAYPGASPQYDGTSLTAGAAYMTELGYYDAYHWIGVDSTTQAIDDALAALAHKGPIVLAIPWLDSMFDARADGTLDTSGGIAGYHAIMARGVHLPRRGVVTTAFPRSKRRVRIKTTEPLVRLRNSWSARWGVDGECLVTASGLEALLHQQGSGMVPTGRKRPK